VAPRHIARESQFRAAEDGNAAALIRQREASKVNDVRVKAKRGARRDERWQRPTRERIAALDAVVAALAVPSRADAARRAKRLCASLSGWRYMNSAWPVAQAANVDVEAKRRRHGRHGQRLGRRRGRRTARAPPAPTPRALTPRTTPAQIAASATARL
jgi:hypothetical protein